MELVLPNNYVALEQEEMMYLDGGGVGRNWWNSRGSFATVLDVGLAIYSGGATIYSAYAISSLIIKHVGSAAGHLVNTALNVALTVTGFSLGGAIAYGADWADGSLDGYIFA
ncbi:TPA: argininosuccinate lyase [Streptococcus pneumoniae]